MRFSARWVWYLLATSLTAAVGCGTAEFDERIDAAAARLQKQLPYRDLDPADAPTLIASFPKPSGPAVQVLFRKPMYYDRSAFAENSADPNNPNTPLKPERLKPPFMQNFPGFQFCYEKIDNPPTGLTISYLYLGAQPTEPGAGERIVGELKATFPDLETLDWSPAAYETPHGDRSTWKTLTLEREQDFWLAGNNAAVPMPAVFKLLMHESQGYQVFLGWRYTKTPADVERFDKLIPPTAGTVVVQSGTKVE